MPLAIKRVLRQFKYAMYFDGVDDYVKNSNFAWNVQQTGLTVGIIINSFKNIIRNDWFSHVSSQTQYGYFILEHQININAFELELRSTDTSEYYATGTNTKYPGSVFQTVFLTWDGLRFCWYVNGSLDTCQADTRLGKGMAFIGYRIGVGTFYAQGYVAQVLFYNRVLSDFEIAWNYNNPYNPVRNGLVLWLQADPQYVKDIDGDGVLEWVDLSGYGNHGKIYGAQLVQFTVAPNRELRVFNYAMYFDGVDDYVSVSSSSINDLGLSFSVMAWINYLRYSKQPSSCADTSLNIASKRIVGIWNNAWVFNISYVRLISGKVALNLPSVPLGEFHFVGFSRSLGKSVTAFVDNNSISYSDLGTDERNTLALNIGGQACLAEYAFGYIAQVLAYNRDLSDSEIQWNYNNPDNPIRDGLILWFKADPNYVKDIDGDGVLEWIDLSGNGNHGKIYGAQLVNLIGAPVR